nr:unnamed protein product [Spirometra erinaceieuropaei]
MRSLHVGRRMDEAKSMRTPPALRVVFRNSLILSGKVMQHGVNQASRGLHFSRAWPFTPSNLWAWFRQVEAVFSTSRITSERTRYSHVVQSLPFDVAVDVDDLLNLIPANDPYTQLKNAVIQRVAKSANRILRELFTQVDLGDQTPSQLMRHMRSFLAGRHMDNVVFRQIWLHKLPVPMQQVLATLDISISLDKMATHADPISECYPVGATCANTQLTSAPDRSDRVAISCPEGTPSLDTCVERSACRCSSRRAATPSGPSRQPNSPHRGDYDDLRDTVHTSLTTGKRPRQPVTATAAVFPVNYAIDWILGRALRDSDGVEFAPGHQLTDLDYADDIALLASSFGDLQSMVSRVNEVAKSVGLSINAGKTKVFSSCIPDQEKAPLGIDGCQLEEVDSF